ncbi:MULTISPECIES: hypothetical protein [unclassified Ruminococcus]|uniref:hypothetical protein n=1 Tax=unclassified Ruminococcus TaxID=2608920 RepID=UPI002109AED8|nr:MULTISPECIES: hypothetical protein [unclassified Ruminococcus]MCQ4022708.1 hypothetical protein [Ruminococcus sp. zg-924]MCQ4114948.1 hypothetical protein [Ruminococcus sp. zg-921]
MKKFIILTAAVIAALTLFGCSNSYTDDLNNSKITPSQTVSQKYPGLNGEYYADGKTQDEATEKLIKNVIPDILKKEITKEGNEQVNTLEVISYDISSYDEGDAATLKINAVLNNGEPMERTVLAFITSEKTDSGYRSYFLSYNNMDQSDNPDDETKQQMLKQSLEQAELGGASKEGTTADTDEAKSDSKE